MARTINEKEHAGKRHQILDVAQQLIYTKGYEQMAIQDILDALGMSKGAFYHYFDSKATLLEALIERMQGEVLDLLSPIVHDPQLTAIEKLQRYFATGVRWKTSHKALMLDLLRTFYADENAIVRQKIVATATRQGMPLLDMIFQQGIREGSLSIPFPEHAGTIFLLLIQGLSDAFVDLLLAPGPHGPTQAAQAARLITAYNDAITRVLGAPAGSITLMEPAALRMWFADELRHETPDTRRETQDPLA